MINKESFKLKSFGLINYFKFKNERFDVKDGVVVLQGENGTGKSLLMSSVMPNLLIMDLRKSTNFGKTRGKNVIDFLKGSKESPSYIWAEIGNDEEVYTLIGIYWTDSNKLLHQRIAIGNKNVLFNEFKLSDQNGNLLNLKKFKKFNIDLIEKIYDNRNEYKHRINDLFFQFPDPDNTLEFFNTNINNIFAIESIKDRSDSNETDSQKLNSMKEDLKRILPDIDENTEEKIMKFIKSIKDQKEADDKMREINTLGSYLEDMKKFSSLINRKYLNEIMNISNQMDEKQNGYSLNVERLTKVIQKEKESLQNYKNKHEDAKNMRKETRTQIELLNIDDINILFDKKENLVSSNKDYLAHKNNLDKFVNGIKEEIRNKNNELNKTEEDILDIKRILQDEGYFYNLIKNDFFINDKVDEQIDLLKEKKQLFENNNLTLAKRKMLEEKISKEEHELKEKEQKLEDGCQQFYKEYKNWLNDISTDLYHEYINNYGISIDTAISYDQEINRYIADETRDYDYNILNINNNINQIKKLIYNEQKELDQLLNKNDFYESVYDYDNGVELFRCIDFKEDVLDRDRKNIESSLADLGLLFTIFDSDKINYGLAYNNIDSQKFNCNLNNFFHINKNLNKDTQNKVYNFLSKISYKDNKINTNLIEYYFSNNNNTGYIGEESRREKRKELIKQKEQVILDYNNNIKELLSEKDIYEKSKNDFTLIVNKKPDYSFYYNDLHNIQELEKQKQVDIKAIEDIDHSLSLYNKRVLEIESSLYDEFEKIDLGKLYDQKTLILRLQENMKSLAYKEQSLNTIKENIEDKEREKERYIEDILEYEEKIKINNIEIKNIEIELQNRGADKALDDVAKLKSKEIELDKEIDKITGKIASLNEKLKTNKNQLEIEQEKLENIINSNSLKEELLKQYQFYAMYDDWSEDLEKMYGLTTNFKKSFEERKSLFNNINYKNHYAFTSNLNIINNYDDVDVIKIIKELNEINFIEFEIKEIGNEKIIPFESLYNDIFYQIKQTSKMNDDERTNQHLREFQASTINKLISDVANKGMKYARYVSEQIEERRQQNSISFFIDYKISNKASRFQKKFFNGSGNMADSDYQRGFSKFIEEIVAIIEKGYDENLTDEEIYDEVYKILNYKEIVDVNIRFIRDGVNIETLSSSTFGGLSNGEKARAVMEPLFVVLRSNLDNSNLKDKALSLILLDEGFGDIDSKQQKFLENNIYNNFSTMIIAEHNRSLKGPDEGAKTINYYTLSKSASLKNILNVDSQILDINNRESYKDKEAIEIYERGN